MPEARIAQSFLEIASTKLKHTPNTKAVRTIYVIVGALRNVDLDSLQLAFDETKCSYEGCMNARLKAEIVPPRAYCREARHRYSPKIEKSLQCPECGKEMGELICGEELDLVSVTLEAAI